MCRVKETRMTKRQLGLLFIALGAAAIIGLFAADFAGASSFGGIGPIQRVAIAGAILLTLAGISLLPLGQRPA